MNKLNIVSLILVFIIIIFLENYYPGFLGSSPELERKGVIVLGLCIFGGIVWGLVIEKVFY